MAAMDRGWPVFPVNGKKPATANGLHDATTDRSRIHTWWGPASDHGLALSTGEPSGVWVLDLDGEEGEQSVLELQKKHGQLPETVAARTGGGGYHLFFQMPEGRDVRNSAGKVAEGVDVRGTGGYVVLPPSPHPSGNRYEWIEGRSPEETSPAPAPEWLLDLVTADVSENGRPAPAEELPETIPAGRRNEMLTSLAGSMRRRGASREAMRAALHEENKGRCDPPLPEDEVDSIADSVGRYEPSENGTGPAPTGDPVVLEKVDSRVTSRIGEKKLEPVDAVPLPWPTWTRACMGAGGREGLAQGWHVIIGAPSGAGKSLTATNLAACALRQGHDTALISLEMSQQEIVTRLLSIYTGDPIRPLEHGAQFDPDAWQAASEQLQEAPGAIHINRTPITSLDQIEAATRHHAEEGCRLIIVDYLQLAWSENADTLYQQIVEVSHVIRGLARELEITTVGLSQVNRRTSAGGNALQKEGLLGGSSLENDADQVVLLGRPERKWGGYESEVQLDKNRHGPKDEWKVLLDPKTLELKELEEEHRE